MVSKLFKAHTSRPKNWHAKRYLIKLTRRRTLLVTARNFRTSKLRRSKRYKQFVMPLYGMPTKELAFRHKVQPMRQPKTYTITIVVRPRVWGAYAFMLVGLAGMTYFGTQVKLAKSLEPTRVYALPTPTPVPEDTKPAVLSRAEPARMNISDVNINAQIKTVGRLADGAMETPNIFDNVTGWYKHSPTPGELGPAIIVGHVDNYKGPSVFWRLRELQPGNIVEIIRTDGSVARFKVDALQQFDQNNFPTGEVYGDINYAGLRLITCSGTFNRQTGHYTANTVVFATLIDDPIVRIEDFRKDLSNSLSYERGRSALAILN